MKRFNGFEFGRLVMAAMLFFGGATLVIWPGEVNSRIETFHTNNSGVLERITEPDSSKCGLVAMAAGAGLAAITVYGRTK
jgi:hypothetical protein